MKLAIISVFLLCALIEASKGQVVVGTLMSVRSLPVGCNSGDFGFKCSTCTTALLCQNTLALTMVSCASENFCDMSTNTCTSVKPPDCPSFTFTCPAAGYFPNAENCRMYYFCTEEKTVQEYKCPPNYVFDITSTGCKRMLNSNNCITMKCQKPMQFLVYSKDPSIYVYCDDTLTGHMFKCLNGYEFDKTSKMCNFICKRSGYYASLTKSTAYFCFKDMTTYNYNIVKCPDGYEFDSKFMCIKSLVTPRWLYIINPYHEQLPQTHESSNI